MTTNHNIKAFPKPSSYTSKIEELNDSKNLILDEFRKVYIISHTNPNSQEYQQQFANASSQLDQVQSNLFSIGNEVQSNTDTMNNSLLDLNVQIDNERKRNAKLHEKLGKVEQQYTSASGMISEYKEYYNINFLRNWALLLSIVLCIYAITIIRVPARSADRVMQNQFQQTALLSLIYNIFVFIPCLLGDVLRFIWKIFSVVFSAIAYIPCLLTGKIEQ